MSSLFASPPAQSQAHLVANVIGFPPADFQLKMPVQLTPRSAATDVDASQTLLAHGKMSNEWLN